MLIEKIFISFEPLEEFQLNFQERCDLILKVTKNHPLNGTWIFGNTRGGDELTLPADLWLTRFLFITSESSIAILLSKRQPCTEVLVSKS